MYYKVVAGAIIVLVILMLLKVELRVEKKDELSAYLIIGKIYKKKLNIKSEKKLKLKRILVNIKMFQQPIVNKILKASIIEEIEIKVGFKVSDSPYIVFLGYMSLLMVKNKLYTMVKKVNKESYNMVINHKKIEGKLKISISLLKLVIIILSNYQEFKMIIKEGVS